MKYGDKTTTRDNAAGKIVSAYVVAFAKADPKSPHLRAGLATNGMGGTMMDFSRQGSAELVHDPWAPRSMRPPRDE